MNKKKMIVLTGPTAVGKTALSIELERRVNGAVVSADSMQVYKYMDIGSAKITPKEMQGVPHYLVDELLPSEEFHVVRFVELAKKYLDQIYAEGKIPIIVGGTGFYIQALLYDIDFTEQDCDEAYRENLELLARERGNAYLHRMLREVDPESAEAIHENNRKRVIRALEFFHLSGEKISQHNESERKKTSPYDFAYFVLNDKRERLYERIDARVDQMVQNGLVEEVMRLRKMGCHSGMVAMQGLGYKEILAHLDGEMTLPEAVYVIKRETRHFAKRQLTWFRRERDVIWLDKDQFGCDEEIWCLQSCGSAGLQSLTEGKIYVARTDRNEDENESVDVGTI